LYDAVKEQVQSTTSETSHEPEALTKKKIVPAPAGNVLVSDISRDRYSAMAQLAEAESCIAAGQLEKAEKACLEAARLFEQLHDDDKSVQAQLLLTEI
jgi:hypothetical protein